MKRSIKFLFLICVIFPCCVFSSRTAAQELNAEVSVTHKKIRGEEASTFNKMQEAIQQFLNTRHWTSTHYKNDERIDCRFLIDLQKEVDDKVYKALITVQSTRPVYNSSYSSILLNYRDKDVAFRFDPYQPLVFNENRISGNDPQASNLTA